jgi:hypothetical protein
MKSGRAEVHLAAQFQSRKFSYRHHASYQESCERLEVMAISINSSTSGFRKWSEAQELRKLDDTRGEAVLAGDIAGPGCRPRGYDTRPDAASSVAGARGG